MLEGLLFIRFADRKYEERRTQTAWSPLEYYINYRRRERQKKGRKDLSFPKNSLTKQDRVAHPRENDAPKKLE